MSKILPLNRLTTGRYHSTFESLPRRLRNVKSHTAPGRHRGDAMNIATIAAFWTVSMLFVP